MGKRLNVATMTEAAMAAGQIGLDRFPIGLNRKAL